MTLADLADQLRAFAEGRTTRDALQAQLAPVLAADPLDVSQSDSTPWDHAHHDARLFWRLVYLFEMLPLIADQERFCAIAEKHVRGVISRTGFLSVVAESGYPAHLKLWLQHAGPGPLARLCERLAAADYATAAASIERAP